MAGRSEEEMSMKQQQHPRRRVSEEDVERPCMGTSVILVVSLCDVFCLAVCAMGGSCKLLTSTFPDMMAREAAETGAVKERVTQAVY